MYLCADALVCLFDACMSYSYLKQVRCVSIYVVHVNLIISYSFFDKSMAYGVATMSRLLKIKVSFAKEPYCRDDILQKRPIILRGLLIVATPYLYTYYYKYHSLLLCICVSNVI